MEGITGNEIIANEMGTGMALGNRDRHFYGY